jgi:hypothetical protein
MSDPRPSKENALVVVYCTACGYQLLEDVDTGEARLSAVWLPRRSIEMLRQTGVCKYCGGKMDAMELPEVDTSDRDPR